MFCFFLFFRSQRLHVFQTNQRQTGAVRRGRRLLQQLEERLSAGKIHCRSDRDRHARVERHRLGGKRVEHVVLGEQDRGKTKKKKTIVIKIPTIVA